MADANGAVGVELPASVHQQLLAVGIQAHQTAMAHLQTSQQRQSDAAAFDMRVIGAVAAGELLVTNDPSEVARLNSAIRTPTTIDHPSAVVGK